MDALKHLPCRSQDGQVVELLANIEYPQDAAGALAAGAVGVGLFRSEFLFMGRGGQLPDEDEQYGAYKQALLGMQGLPVTIRTLDIGADKPLDGHSSAHAECDSAENPALGLRGLRFSLARKDIFSAQLAALLRAGAKGDLRIMFPMVTTPEDLFAALEVVETVKQNLRARGILFNENVPMGIMIETPAAALMAHELAQHAAFFSIGTNDLVQYTHAVDRVNPLVEAYYPTHSQPVRKLMRMAVSCAQIAGIPVSVCGESAADPATAAEYVQFGIHTLSMSARSILEVKEALLEQSTPV